MKLGVFTVLFGDQPLEAALDRAVEAGLDCVEIGTGNYPGNRHCRPAEPAQRRVEAGGVPLGHRLARAWSSARCPATAIRSIRRVKSLAPATRPSCVPWSWPRGWTWVASTSSPAVPATPDTATYPNWVTCAWPTDYGELLEWQWREKVLPYWREQAAFAAKHGVRLGFEMHPGFVVYNPRTLLRLRDECGENVGANLDPSHLFWQGIDVETAIAELGRAGAIFHTHAKDTAIHPRNTALNGVLDTTPLSRVAERSWIFRTVGYGHGELDWRRILTALRLAGYDDVLSIEHEDALLSIDEGFRKGVAFLRSVMPVEPALSDAWWT